MSAALDGRVNKTVWSKEAKAKVSVEPVKVNASRFVPFTEFNVYISYSPTRQTEAIVFQPLGAKLQLFDFFALRYPAVFGVLLGDSVVSSDSANFGSSDLVAASRPTNSWRDNRYGTLQHDALVCASNAIKVTEERYSVLDAVTIPTQACVAALVLGQVAGLERPIMNAAVKEGAVLVSGAGSTAGTYPVRHAPRAGYTDIITANLPTSAEESVTCLGALHVIKYSLPATETVDALKDAVLSWPSSTPPRNILPPAHSARSSLLPNPTPPSALYTARFPTDREQWMPASPCDTLHLSGLGSG